MAVEQQIDSLILEQEIGTLVLKRKNMKNDLKKLEEDILAKRVEKFTKETGISIGSIIPTLGRVCEICPSVHDSYITGYYLAFKKDGTIGKFRRYVGFSKSVIELYNKGEK